MISNLFPAFRRILISRFVRLSMARRLSIRYCIENDLLPSLIARTPTHRVRELLNLPRSDNYTQLNQDIFALLMNQFRPGYFLEIGANDGFTLSNTVYLEENFGWSGALVEANPRYLSSLKKRMNSVIVNKAVSTRTGTADFVDAGLYGGLKDGLDESYASHTGDAPCISVKCLSLQDILDEIDAPERIDFISIDVEGGELSIVEQMVSNSRRFRCGCIEHNERLADLRRMAALLESANYDVIWNRQTEHDLFFVDALSGHTS